MNNDRIVGATRETFGTSERLVGDVVGKDRIATDGVITQVSGALQHGYGEVKDGVSAVLDNAPDVASQAFDAGRRLARQTDKLLQDKLGDAAPLYVLAGAVGLLAIAVFWAGRDR